MARATKPGAPGKTKIPTDVVKDVTCRLRKAFQKTAKAQCGDLVVIAQQHYLYLETEERPSEIMAGLILLRLGKRKRRGRTPLGRMVWLGNPEKWRLELYKWSDECWDAKNDAGTPGGSPEECMEEALLGWGA